MPIIAFYASLLVLLYILLTARTILLRFSARVSIGAGGDKELLRWRRNRVDARPFRACLWHVAAQGYFAAAHRRHDRNSIRPHPAGLELLRSTDAADPDALTPREALAALYELKGKLEK